jgi:hypothetical protein
MINSPCKAAIPASCRFHGLGSKLPDDAYKQILSQINQDLARSAPYRLEHVKGDEQLFNNLQNGLAEFYWKNYLKTYRHETKLKAAKETMLKHKPVVTSSDEIFNKAVDVFNKSTELDFTSYQSQTLPFKSVVFPVKSKNNCSQVSVLVVKNFDAKDFGSDSPLKIVRVDAPDSNKPHMFWHHAAVEVERDGERFVVDYTINQFDKTQPVPYVDTIQNWTAKLNQITGEGWSEEHLGSWSVQGGEVKENLTRR